MGIAAYNRGTKVLLERLDMEQTPALLRLMADLTSWSDRHDGPVPFMPTVVRYDPARKEWHLMSRQEGGFGAYSYGYHSLWAVARHWRVAFTEYGEDQHSRYFRVVPLPRNKQ